MMSISPALMADCEKPVTAVNEIMIATRTVYFMLFLTLRRSKNPYAIEVSREICIPLRARMWLIPSLEKSRLTLSASASLFPSSIAERRVYVSLFTHF